LLVAFACASGCELVFPVSTSASVDAAGDADVDAGIEPSCLSFSSETATGVAGRNPAMNASWIEMIVIDDIPASSTWGLYRSTFATTWSLPTRITGLSDNPQDSPAFYPDDYDQIVYAGGTSGRILGAERPKYGAPWVNTVPDIVIPAPMDDLQCGPPSVVIGEGRRMVLSRRAGGAPANELDLVEYVQLANGEYEPNVQQTLALVNRGGVADRDPHLSADGLVLWFASDRDGDYDIYRTTRPTIFDMFASPCRVALLDASDERGPWPSPDEAKLAFSRGPDLGEQIFLADAD
jgi:hypothetical protein